MEDEKGQAQQGQPTLAAAAPDHAATTSTSAQPPSQIRFSSFTAVNPSPSTPLGGSSERVSSSKQPTQPSLEPQIKSEHAHVTEKASQQNELPNSKSSTPQSVPQKSLPSQPAAVRTSMTTDADPLKDAQATNSNEDVAMTDAPTYGTRSRGRNTGSRPNYAEDQDMDFEYSAPTKSESKRASAATDKFPAAGFRAVNDAAPGNAVPSSDADASSSSTGLSKKRKAPATTSQSAQSSAAIIRKATTTSSQPLRKAELTNVVSFAKSGAKLNAAGQLVADDGTIFNVDDNAYLVCEPPGEPYYLCRIMEFMHAGNKPENPVDCLRVNWFYRSRDVQRYNQDTRLVYATMHSDICPLTSLRGKCVISHRSEIDDLDQYRKNPNHFWFNQCNDRFIKRFYEVVPTSQIVNVPEKVKKALDERWKYIIVESSRVKELTSAVKLCKRCSQYCASHDSVDCAICGNAYHMNCVRPPLPKKPSRGFAWACGPCSRAQEKRLEGALSSQPIGEDVEEEFLDEEEEDPALAGSTRAASPDSNTDKDKPAATKAELSLVNQWHMRYLGIHCRVEDALHFDERDIYPRAGSRLGPRHQANVPIWYGHPVELVKPIDLKKKYMKSNSHKKDAKLSKEAQAALDAGRIERANRPKWVMDEPAGYVARGEDYPNDDPRNTARLLFKMPDPIADHGKSINGQKIDPVDDAAVDAYMNRARSLHKGLKVSEWGVNLADKALSLLIDNNYDWQKAFEKLSTVDRGKDLKEPIFTHDDLRKFEEGVFKYGSEHRLVKQHMKSNLQTWAIIRFYYLWKKTPRGHQIWDNYGGRKSAKIQRQNLDAATKLQQELADDGDDSAFDSAKASARKREFQCKFCNRKHSPIWRRAPGVTPGQTAPAEKGANKDKVRPLLALCMRCANLWRRYAVEWEDLDEVGRKMASGFGKSWKRRIDEEYLKELQAESNMDAREAQEVQAVTPEVEPAKKRSKTEAAVPKAKPAPPKAPTPPPPIVPDKPKWRQLPCFVCNNVDHRDQKPLSCTHCKLTVHKHCYGISDRSATGKWVCDQCTNDRTPEVSTDYVCALCPIEFTPRDLWEAPKVSHKKKNDRDKEKERMEKELLDKAKLEYTKRQSDLHRPLQPREPLKKTDGNNWAHVLCSVWTPEIKFSDAKQLEKAEGFSTIPLNKFEAMCKLCKNARHGACVACLQCHANFHVACAYEAGYVFGFDITPVKNSRKDQITTVTVGQESGYMTAAIWCRDHSVKTIIHPMTETVDETGKTALELFVENYKQADQTLTGTARKANLLSLSARAQAQNAPATANNRRVSLISTSGANGQRRGRNSIANGDDAETSSPTTNKGPGLPEQPDKKCVKCGVEVSPKWWPLPAPSLPPYGGMNGILNEPEEVNGDRSAGSALECHKCHHKASKPPGRIPLSPKPLNITLDWPPSISGPVELRQIWTDTPVYTNRQSGGPGSPQDFRGPGNWDYQRQTYRPHYGHHPSQPPAGTNGGRPPLDSYPSSNGGSLYERQVPPAPLSASGHSQPGTPLIPLILPQATSSFPPPPRTTGSPYAYPGNSAARAAARAASIAEAREHGRDHGFDHTSPRPGLNHQHSHGSQGPSGQPSSGSAGNSVVGSGQRDSHPPSGPRAPPPPLPLEASNGLPPPPHVGKIPHQPATPGLATLEPRPTASSSPHIGNLLH